MYRDATEVTRLLDRLREGDLQAEQALVTEIYEDLHELAIASMRRERPDHTLQPTALLHEAFLRFRPQLKHAVNRRYLFGAARDAMRRVLIDHARARHAQKRQADEAGDAPTPKTAASPLPQWWRLDLIEALEELSQLDPRQYRIVEYRFLIGLTVEQVAEQLRLSVSQVEKDWRCARAWLYRRLKESP